MLNRLLLMGAMLCSLWISHAHGEVALAAQAMQQGDPRRALTMLETARPSEDMTVRLLRSMALADLQRDSEAREMYQALITDYPTHPVAYNNLAVLLARQGLMAEARAMLEQALRQDAVYAVVYDNLTRLTVAMSRDAYARALRLPEDDGGPVLVALNQQVLSASLNAQPVEPIEVAQEASPAVALLAAAEPDPVLPATAPAANAADLPAQAQAERAEILAEVTPAELINAQMHAWAKAWSAQDVAGYLAAYSEDFVPSGRLTLAQWREQRRQRLQRPGRIEVTLDEMEILIFDATHARVRLLQDYRSDRYRDRSRKEFQLVYQQDRWLITAERTLEVIR